MIPKEQNFDVIQIIQAPPGVYVWTTSGEQTIIDPVPCFALVEYTDTQRHGVFPMRTKKDSLELTVIASGGVLEYKPPEKRNKSFERNFKT